MLKVALNTRRQGQARGQVAALAAQHHVSARWLRLIAYGTLEDPAFVEALRDAAKTPQLWDLVAPAALEALARPTEKIERLGGTLDQLLVGLLESHQILRRPINQNFARQTSALEQVNQSLDRALQDRLEADADRGRRSLKSVAAATAANAAKAAERRQRYQAEVDARRPGVPKTTKYQSIARRDQLASAEAVKKVLARGKKPPRTK